jgi:predicted signal transduction protein with EAL and GGDEF domain
VVLSILRLSETLNLETVAEGIEEPSQLALLRELGANLGQGYLFARPMDTDAMAALIAADAPLGEAAAAPGVGATPPAPAASEPAGADAPPARRIA